METEIDCQIRIWKFNQRPKIFIILKRKYLMYDEHDGYYHSSCWWLMNISLVFVFMSPISQLFAPHLPGPIRSQYWHCHWPITLQYLSAEHISKQKLWPELNHKDTRLSLSYRKIVAHVKFITFWARIILLRLLLFEKYNKPSLDVL